MRRTALLLAVMLVACGPRGNAAGQGTAGQRLEQAALAAGLLPPDPGTLTGLWTREGDRMCVGAPSAEGGAQRVGLVLDYGPGNSCVAHGTLARDEERLTADLGACTVAARLEGGRIMFPSDLDRTCASLCRGNATLSALRVERISDSAAEAAVLRSPSGTTLCGD